jgi:hypothetical protein
VAVADADFRLPTENLANIARCIAGTTDAAPQGAFLDCLEDELPPEEHWPALLSLVRDRPGVNQFRSRNFESRRR